MTDITNSCPTITATRIMKAFEVEVKEAFDICVGMRDDDDFDELIEQFIQGEFNTENIDEEACLEFVENNLRVYLEFEKYCKEYMESNIGDEWTGGGLVKVVNLWRYIHASDYLRTNAESWY